MQYTVSALLPSETDFELAEVALPEVRDGELLVQNIYMSVDPYMRGRMVDRKSYVPPFQLGQPLDGGSVGRVTASKNKQFQDGDYVIGMAGWRERFISDGAGFMKIDADLAPITKEPGDVAEVCVVRPEVVVRIDAHDRIEESVGEGQGVSLGVNRELNIATSDPDAVERLISQLFVPDMKKSVEVSKPLKVGLLDHVVELIADEV